MTIKHLVLCSGKTITEGMPSFMGKVPVKLMNIAEGDDYYALLWLPFHDGAYWDNDQFSACHERVHKHAVESAFDFDEVDEGEVPE